MESAIRRLDPPGDKAWLPTIARLCLEMSPELYACFSDNRDELLVQIERTFDTPGTDNELCWVSHIGAELVGFSTCCPSSERSRREMRSSLVLSKLGSIKASRMQDLRKYALQFPESSKEGWYWVRMAIAPQFRGRGAGRELFQHQVNMLKAFGKFDFLTRRANYPILKLSAEMGLKAADDPQKRPWVRVFFDPAEPVA